MKKIIALSTLLMLMLGQSAFSQNYTEDFNNFTKALGDNDSAEVMKFFESDDMYHQCKWEIYNPDFVATILKLKYSDLEDSYMGGEKIKEYMMVYTSEDEEGAWETTIYLYFKKLPSGFKMIDFARPEGTDAP